MCVSVACVCLFVSVQRTTKMFHPLVVLSCQDDPSFGMTCTCVFISVFVCVCVSLCNILQR